MCTFFSYPDEFDFSSLIFFKYKKSNTNSQPRRKTAGVPALGARQASGSGTAATQRDGRVERSNTHTHTSFSFLGSFADFF
jgi:hypothetical protein